MRQAVFVFALCMLYFCGLERDRVCVFGMRGCYCKVKSRAERGVGIYENRNSSFLLINWWRESALGR